MRSRPNILLIHADQHRYDCVGAHGHPFLKTPNLDRLAREGVDYTHAFTPNPVCSPARACLQTGAWATTHRCVTIPTTEAFQSADPALPVLTRLVADRGYRVAHVGKFHSEVTGGPTDHGAEEFVPYHAYKKWREAQGLPPQPRANGWFGETDPHVTPEQTPLAWQADNVLRILEDFGRGERPFFVRWDPPEPHLPNVLPEPYASLYPAETIPPWPSFPDPLTGKPDAQRRTRLRWGTDAWGWEEWQPIVGRYLGEVALLDAQVGRLLDALDRWGMAENTLVVYSCDHGDMCGGHGMMDKHYCMYEDILRVPLFARWPGVLPAGSVCDAFLIQELDIARTLLEAAGVDDVPPSFVGRSLVAAATGADPEPRPDIFSQYMGTHQGLYSLRMLRDRRFKYVFQPAGRDELYDLESDPGELTNLADDPGHADTLLRMRERMGEWMRGIGDRLSPPLYSWR